MNCIKKRPIIQSFCVKRWLNKKQKKTILAVNMAYVADTA